MSRTCRFTSLAPTVTRPKAVKTASLPKLREIPLSQPLAHQAGERFQIRSLHHPLDLLTALAVDQTIVVRGALFFRRGYCK